MQKFNSKYNYSIKIPNNYSEYEAKKNAFFDTIR